MRSRRLRESLCLPTPRVELKCDNTAGIVLATGEGSWRTKSAANKVHAVKEKVEIGSLIVTFVGTRDQCADSLTKFLKGGQEQIRATEQLSLVNLEKWLPRKTELVTKARGIRLSGCPEFSGFAPGVFRVSASGPDRPAKAGTGASTGPPATAANAGRCAPQRPRPLPAARPPMPLRTRRCA